ncbi:hypothetical protein L3i22_026600 [Actinoplanes sp. L3-i22]|nr:ALF repeat-containing protein [Actinoplanes sp. L3-i22]BCY07572.1 hypothetical protein L3i22_026600 [Actinoplanes sp. L3-i22]
MFSIRPRDAAIAGLSALAVALPAAAVPAFAAPLPQSVTAAAATTPATDRYRVLVRRLADLDPRWEVRAAAWNALLSDLPTAVTAFLSTGGGYEQARSRATADAARNDLVISRAILTSTPTTSPIVYLTANRASHGTLDEKDRYVRTGLKEAQALDAAHSPIEAAKQQAKLDRDYVTDLAAHAPGAWVRAAAQRAIQKGTDADIAEFFKYSWASASDCDLQSFRMDAIEQEQRYRHQLEQLVTLAQQAQVAYEQAADAAKAKAAEEAKAAWNTAADLAASTQATWQANQDLATTQARMWAAVHDFALLATTQQDWSAIANQATGANTSWSDELAWAQDQAQQWTALAESTRASAEAIPADGSPSPSPSVTPSEIPSESPTATPSESPAA